MCTLVGVVGCLLFSHLIKEVVLAVISRVCVDGMFCWTDSEVALCWVKKGKEKCLKRWVKNRVVAIRKVVNCDSGDIYKELQTQHISQQGFVM